MDRTSGKVSTVPDIVSNFLNWSTRRTFRGEENGLFGDVVGIKKNGEIYLIMLFEVPNKGGKNELNIHINNGNLDVTYTTNGDSNDLEPIYVNGESCVLFCNEDRNSDIRC